MLKKLHKLLYSLKSTIIDSLFFYVEFNHVKNINAYFLFHDYTEIRINKFTSYFFIHNIKLSQKYISYVKSIQALC